MPVVCERNRQTTKPLPGHLGRFPSGQEEKLVGCRNHIQETLGCLRAEAAGICNQLDSFEQVDKVLAAKTDGTLRKVLQGLGVEIDVPDE